MATINKSTKNKCGGCGEKGTLLHCWWGRKLVQPLWKTLCKLFRKTGNRVAVWSSNPTPGQTARQNCNSKRYMHPYAHNSTIHSSQDTEMTYMPINRSTDKEGVCVCVYIYISHGTHGNISQPYKRTKSCHLQQHGGTQKLNEVSQKDKYRTSRICGV